MLVLWGIMLRRDEQAEVELGKLEEVVPLRMYMRPGDEKLAPEKLGMRIDPRLAAARTLAPTQGTPGGLSPCSPLKTPYIPSVRGGEVRAIAF